MTNASAMIIIVIKDHLGRSKHYGECMWFLWEIGVNVVKWTIVFWSLSKLAGFRAAHNSKRLAVCGAIAFVCAQSILNYTVQDGYMIVLVMDPLLIAYAAPCFGSSVGIRVFWGCLCCTVIAAANQIVSFVMVQTALTSLQLLRNPSAGRILPTILYLAILSSLFTGMMHFPKIKADLPTNMQLTIVAMSLPLCLLSAVLQTTVRVTALEPWARSLYQTYLLAASLFGVGFCIALYLLLRYAQQNEEQTLKLRNVAWRTKADAEQLELTRRWLHDERQHWAVLNALASARDLDGIRSYLRSLHSTLDDMLYVSFTGDTAIDAILAAKKTAAARNGTPLIIHAQPIRRNPLTELETAQLIGNLIDNAIDASRIIAEEDTGKSPSIELTVGERGKMFHVSVSNPYSSDARTAAGNPRDPRCELGHGFGLGNIHRIIENAEGFICVDASGGIWSADVWIPVRDQKDSR